MLIPEWLLIIVVTGMLGLLGWIGRLLFAIQLAMVGLKTTMDLQLGRIASDIESEKETRARVHSDICLLYTSPSPRDPKTSRMPSSA